MKHFYRKIIGNNGEMFFDKILEKEKQKQHKITF